MSTQETELKPAFKAESIIQRDAIMSALKASGIDAYTAPRDISRKIADSTVDLAYEGYSAVFDGFIIHVPEGDLEQAQKIAEKVVKAAQTLRKDSSVGQSGAMQKFYFCCLFSLMLPGVFHLLAAYHLFVALKAGEKFHKIYGGVMAAIWLSTGGCLLYILATADWMSVLQSMAEAL